jgi:hypothetical protein
VCQWDSTLGYPEEGPATSQTPLRVLSQNVTGTSNAHHIFSTHANACDVILLQEAKLPASKEADFKQKVSM